MSAEGIVENAEVFAGKAREVVVLKIRLFDDSGKMLPSAAYHLEAGNEKYDGAANNGWVEKKLKANATPESCWLEWEKDQSGNFLYCLELNLKFEGSKEESLTKHLKNIGYIPDPEMNGGAPADSQMPDDVRNRISDMVDDFKSRFYLRANVKPDEIVKLSEKGVEDVKLGDTLLASLQ
jgi:hypothetical protein